MTNQDKSGTLERPEVVRALIKSLPGVNGLNEQWLTESFGQSWALFDINNDGAL